ncbi:MAG: leucyl/phenylalanyl-tRNA--protein transferase, partial [Pyrinomonadaceae bacterium]
FADLKVPRSLEKIRRNSDLRFTIDRDFLSVIRECSATKRPGQRGTWISSEFVDVFAELHKRGMAHSIEAWDPLDNLVGGLYGIDACGVFCGESMFYKTANASKLALLFLIDHLRLRGATWLDAQVMTPHMAALGAKEIDRDKFLDKLVLVQTKGLVLF